MRQAICFDPVEGKPRFMWTTFEFVDEGDEEYCWEYPDFKRLMAKDRFCRGIMIEKNAWSSIDMGYGIKLYYDDNSAGNYDSINQAITTATKGKNSFQWKGPLFAVCGAVVNDMENLVKLADMDMKAYADGVAFLSNH